MPWVTYKLKRAIKKKYYLYNLLRRGLINKSRYNTYRKILNVTCDKMRRLYYYKLFLNARSSKESWRAVNSFLDRNSSNSPSNIVSDNGRVLRGVDLCEYFNEYFSNIGGEIAKIFPYAINFEFFGGLKSIANSCVMVPSCPEEVQSLINAMKNKGNSLYDIKGNLLKKVGDVLAPILSYLFNKCLFAGVYPTELKTARVIPVFKSGSHSSVHNYRPISNLSVFNKIFEKLTLNRLNSFIESNQLLSIYQHGFRKLSNTTVASFRIINDFLLTLNKKNVTIALFLDLKKAFDTIDRDILLYKLQFYGFRGIINRFLSSYLSGRKQFVNVSSFQSDCANIDIGVPQGSVL